MQRTGFTVDLLYEPNEKVSNKSFCLSLLILSTSESNLYQILQSNFNFLHNVWYFEALDASASGRKPSDKQTTTNEGICVFAFFFFSSVDH